MSRQEGSALLERVATQMFEEMQDDPSATLGPAENKVFDILGVPRSFGPECRGPDSPRFP